MTSSASSNVPGEVTRVTGGSVVVEVSGARVVVTAAVVDVGASLVVTIVGGGVDVVSIPGAVVVVSVAAGAVVSVAVVDGAGEDEHAVARARALLMRSRFTSVQPVRRGYVWCPSVVVGIPAV